MVTVRAVYRDNRLELLDRVELQEGQEVQVQIIDPLAFLQEALSDLDVSFPEPVNDQEEFDEEALQQWLDEQTAGVTVSDLIIEERRNGR